MADKLNQTDHQHNHRERLRERYLKNGLDGFHNYEVLELMLTYAIPRRDTKDLAKRLIAKFGSLTDVLNAPVSLLVKEGEIGERTAIMIKLFRDVHVHHMRENLIDREYISAAEDVVRYLHTACKGLKEEVFKVLYLNNRNMILYEETLFEGTVNETRVYPRKILENVLLLRATAIIIVHNHPGGHLKPSRDDQLITQRIQTALATVDVQLLDHIIIADHGHYSFAREGKL